MEATNTDSYSPHNHWICTESAGLFDCQ